MQDIFPKLDRINATRRCYRFHFFTLLSTSDMHIMYDACWDCPYGRFFSDKHYSSHLMLEAYTLWPVIPKTTQTHRRANSHFAIDRLSAHPKRLMVVRYNGLLKLRSQLWMTSAYSSPPRIIVGYSPSSQKPAPLPQTVYRVSSQHYNGNENGDDGLSSCEDQNDMKSHHIFVHDSSQNYERHESQHHQQTITGDNGDVRVVMYPHSIPNGSKQPEIKMVELPSPSSIPAYALEPSSIQSNHPHHYSTISSMPGSFAPQGTVEYVVVHDQRSLMSDQLNSRVHVVENQTMNGAHNFHYAPKLEPEMHVGRKEKDAQRKRRKRADETDMDAESRRSKNLAAKRRRLEKESEDERMRRRARDAETKRLRRQRETPEQRKKRLTRDSERMRRTRRLKKILGPSASLSDPESLKRNGITLQDLDVEPPKRKKQKEPNQRSIPSDSLNSTIESNGETVIIQSQVEQPALYVSNQKSYANRNLPSSSNSQAQIVVSRNIPQHVESISRHSLQANSHLLQQQQNFEVRRSVPSSSAGPAQHHVLSHAGGMPIPITVEPGTQVVTLHLSIPNSQQQHILHLPQSSLPQHIIVQRQPIPQPSTSTIEIPHASAHSSHQQQNIVQALHSYPQVVTRNITEEYQPPPQQTVCVNTPTRRPNVTTVSSYTPKLHVHDSSRQPLEIHSIDDQSEMKHMLTDEQIMRRRRNAERSRRRRAMESPQQRAERNRRTAERMRNRRAKLAAERQNRGEIIIQRPIRPLSVDRFEEIFQSVISQCTKTEVKSELDQNLELDDSKKDINIGDSLVNMETLANSSQAQMSQMSPGGTIEDREMFSGHGQNLSMCSEVSLHSLSSTQSIYDQSTPEYTHQTSDYDDPCLGSPRLDAMEQHEHSERDPNDSQPYEPHFEGL
ncbi:zinc finger protein [Ditylenchus destructor]|nr:zinc finger protein [Ditylenchus destructor]